MVRTSPGGSRSAVAAVELAFLLPFLMSLLFGIWEVGRYLDAMLILEGAAREGGRQAAAGSRIDSITGSMTLIYAHPTDGQTDVETAVKNYLARAGCKVDNVVVTYANTSSTPAPYPYTDKSDPYEANRLDQLEVTVSIPYNDVRWSPTQMFVKHNSVMSVKVVTFSMRDDVFQVNSTIPND